MATLVIMAAWMWSRYGWLKQIDAFWPHGETLLEYSIFDAKRAWFSDVVLLIRESFHQQFIETFWNRFMHHIPTKFVYQEINPTIPWYDLPVRTKPWWTWHAVLCVKDVVTWPFCVVNADDYYGRDAFVQMYTRLEQECHPHVCGMVGYYLKHTLSDHGTVNRWICTVDASSQLQSIHEHTKLQRHSLTTVVAESWQVFSDDAIVSMNMRWFDPSVFAVFEEEFYRFLDAHAHEDGAEFFITLAPHRFVRQSSTNCHVMISNDAWYGVTYSHDKPLVKKAIASLVVKGIYPERLWS